MNEAYPPSHQFVTARHRDPSPAVLLNFMCMLKFMPSAIFSHIIAYRNTKHEKILINHFYSSRNEPAITG